MTTIDWEEIKRDIHTVGRPKEENRAYQEVCKAEKLLAQWQRFASYCRCCAQSGEPEPQDFETFINFTANR